MEANYIASIRNYAQLLQRERKLSLGIWNAKISYLGHPETIYCRHAQLSPDTLRHKQWRSSDKGTLVEHILHALKILGIGPMSLFPESTSLSRTALIRSFMCMEIGWAASFLQFWRPTRVATRISAVLRYGYVRLHCFRKCGLTIWRAPSRSGRIHPSQLEGIIFSTVMR